MIKTQTSNSTVVSKINEALATMNTAVTRMQTVEPALTLKMLSCLALLSEDLLADSDLKREALRLLLS